MSRRCPHCRKAFEPSSGKQRYCGRKCYSAVYEVVNRKKIRKRQTAYRAANRDRIHQQHAAYYAAIRAGQLLKIEVLDHIVMGQPDGDGNKGYSSLGEPGYFYS